MVQPPGANSLTVSAADLSARGVSAADNETGTRMALDKLAALVGPGSSS